MVFHNTTPLILATLFYIIVWPEQARILKPNPRNNF
jgi:hypothetical protein